MLFSLEETCLRSVGRQRAPSSPHSTHISPERVALSTPLSNHFLQISRFLCKGSLNSTSKSILKAFKTLLPPVLALGWVGFFLAFLHDDIFTSWETGTAQGSCEVARSTRGEGGKRGRRDTHDTVSRTLHAVRKLCAHTCALSAGLRVLWWRWDFIPGWEIPLGRGDPGGGVPFLVEGLRCKGEITAWKEEYFHRGRWPG